jgi:signal transduction histidine kinase
VLDISRIEAGEIEINKIEFDIVELLNEILEVNQKYFDEKNLVLTKELPSENIILKADKEKISKVINELLNNSIKFTNIKGRITVSVQSLYKEFEISITDTGIGIPEKDLPYIFQKFYKVSHPGTEIPGTGLGLVFAKQIVDLHKGFISIQSGVNKGTTVILKLPR